MEQSARITGLILTDNTRLKGYGERLPVKYIHSDRVLNQSTYPWKGEVQLGQLEATDTLVTIDTFAVRQVHKTDGHIVRVRTGMYKDKANDQQRHKKVMGIIRNETLYVVTSKADKRFEDISELGPVRITGLSHAYAVARKYARRFSSSDSDQKSA